MAATAQNDAVQVVQLPLDRLPDIEPQVRDLCGGGRLNFVILGLTGTEERPVETVAASPSARRGYALRKHSGIWHVVLAGRTAFILDDRAMQLVAYLLLNPPKEPVHAVPLENRVWGGDGSEGAAPEEAAQGNGEGDAAEPVVEGSASDRQACGAQLNKGENTLLKKRFRELLEIVDDATLPGAERDAAQMELDELHQALDGTAARTIDSAAKTAERVRKLIKRLHTKLASATDEYNRPHPVLREFAEHLNRYLIIPSSRFAKGKGSRNRAGVAGTFIYEPPAGVVWNN